MKIFCLYVLVSGAFGVFGLSSNSDSLNSLNSVVKKLEEDSKKDSNFDISLNKQASISALTTVCDDTSSCNSETITDDYVLCPGYSSCQSSTISFSSYIVIGGMWSGASSTITASADGGNAICAGYWSCYNAALTTNEGRIRCVGSVACYSSTITSSDGHGYCKGNWACGFSVINAHTTTCEGTQSCIGTNIMASSVLYVTGDNSLIDSYISGTPFIWDIGENTFIGATISSNGTSTLIIESYGHYSTSNATILCYNDATCRLRCLGDESCSGTTFYCENNANCRTRCASCSSCPSIIYVDSIDNEIDSLLLKSGDKNDIKKQQDIEIAPVIMQNNVRLNNGISGNNKNFGFFNNIDLITNGTLILLVKILCLLFVYEIFKKFVSRCFSHGKKHEYQEIDDASLRYTPESNAMSVVL